MTGIIQLECEYTKETLMEVQKPLHKKAARLCSILAAASYVVAAAGIVCTIIGVNFSPFAMIFFGGFLGVFFTLTTNKAARKSTQATLKSHQKRYGETVKTTLYFYNSMVTAVNHQSGSEKKFTYDDFARIIRTTNIIMLITADNVAVMGDCRTVNSEDVHTLWDHLLEQCPEAKFEFSL